MYKIKDGFVGKLYCYTKGCFPLIDLSQKQLKELFKDGCPHIEYGEETTTEQEASTQEPVRSKDETNTSNGGSRRKANRRKGSEKSKAD